jgi:hypothetical protein
MVYTPMILGLESGIINTIGHTIFWMVFSVRIGSILLAVICLIVVLEASTLLAQPASRVELVTNGGFENGWEGWEKYSLGRGYASFDPVKPYDGQFSLAIQGTPTPQSGTEYGSGVRQNIEGSPLPINLDFSFWVKPWVSGKGIVQIKAMLTLYTSRQSAESSVLKIIYYVAWRGDAESWANVRPDEADYFVRGVTPFSWNYFEANVQNDFEERWGDSSGVSLSKIALNIEITVGYPGMSTEYANWDDISLLANTPTVTTTQTTPLTSYSISTSANEETSMTGSTTQTTQEGSFFTGFGLVPVVVIVILVVSTLVVLYIRRRRPKPATVQPTAKYCINCGAAMATTGKYCPKCGSSQ